MRSFEKRTADKRLLALYHYWCWRRGSRRFPAREDIDPIDFAFALGRVSIIEINREPLTFRYRLVSTQLTEHLGYEMSGKYVDDIPSSGHREFARAFYERALAEAAPLYETGTAVIDDYAWWHETLVLPLASDGENIDMLLIYRNTRRPEMVDPRYREVV